MHAHISLRLMPSVCFKDRFDPKAHIDVCVSCTLMWNEMYSSVTWITMDGSKTTKGNGSLLGSSRKFSVVTKSGGHWNIWVWESRKLKAVYWVLKRLLWLTENLESNTISWLFPQLCHPDLLYGHSGGSRVHSAQQDVNKSTTWE